MSENIIDSATIDKLLEQYIKEFEPEVQVAEEGRIEEVGDGIARISGLRGCMAGEMLIFGEDVYGMAFNLEEKEIGAVILGEYTKLKEGDPVKRTGNIVRVPVGEAVVGRVVNAIGEPIDGKGDIKSDSFLPIERLAPLVIDRFPVKEPLQTGTKAIDSMIPIGRGQRELIIGDRQTGKTTIAIDAIINQKNTDVICVYVAIGQKQSNVAQVVETLERAGAMDYTIIVSAPADSPASQQWMAPFTGCTLAEHFLYSGKHTLVIYDDLTKHAQAYRQMSLLLRRPPGREAYPGDVFYLHSRLLERACKLSEALGSGSLTALPIVETQGGDVSTYIPTNVISITDGQIFLETDLFYAGIRPAINVGISVSRVGGTAQVKAMRQVAGTLRLDLAQFRALEAFAQFGSDLDAVTMAQLRRGARMVELLKQSRLAPMLVEEQVVAIYAGSKGFIDDIPVDRVSDFEKKLIEFIKTTASDIITSIRDEKAISPAVEEKLGSAITEFKKTF